MNRRVLVVILTCGLEAILALAHDGHEHGASGIDAQTPAFELTTLGSDRQEEFSAHLSADGGYADGGGSTYKRNPR